jgi:hypothetical protein
MAARRERSGPAAMNEHDSEAAGLRPEPDRLFIATAGVLALVGVALVALLALRHSLDPDEIEHVHAGWLMTRGLRPYTDFFEHHHPLLWQVLAWVLPLMGQTAETIVVLRAGALALFLGIVALTRRLASAASGDRETAIVASVLLLSMNQFVLRAYDIRPDVPQVLFVVLAGLWLLNAMPPRRTVAFAAAGLAVGVAVAFSLKAIVLVGLWSGLAGLGWLGKRVRLVDVAAFAGSCAIPPVLMLLSPAAGGSLADYYACNFTYNALARLPPKPAPPYVFVNAPFWILAAGGGLHALVRPRARPALRLVAVTGLGLMVLFAVLRRSDGRTILLALPFLAVTAAHGFTAFSRAAGLHALARSTLLVALCAAPFVQTSYWIAETNRQQLAAIRFVLERTRPEEAVYDGNRRFNLFRPDLDYFWFLPTSARGDSASAARARRFLYERFVAPYPGRAGWDPRDQDACALVRKRRPRIASGYQLDWDRCGLRDVYGPTAHAGVFERRPRGGAPASPRPERPLLPAEPAGSTGGE